MKWLEYKIDTTEEGLEAVYARLESIGIDSIEMRLSSEHIAADLDACRDTWDFAERDVTASASPAVVAYIPTADAETLGAKLEAEMRLLAELNTGLSLGTLNVSVSEIEDQDWAENWKKSFKQLPIGERFLVCPAWETPVNAEGRSVIMMESGLAFGTGQHETTRMCLELYDEFGHGGRILDVGCGSGILSVGALLDGADTALALDIDGDAVVTARNNAENNGIAPERYSALAGDVLSDTALRAEIGAVRYDAIFANIVAGVIVRLNEFVPDWLAEGGIYIVSGIINERLLEVEASLEQHGFFILKTLCEGEWCAMLAVHCETDA